jgi:hypothetical protein
MRGGGWGRSAEKKERDATFLAVTDERGNTARVLALKSRGKLSRGDIFGPQSKSLDLEHAAEFKYIYVCIEIVSPSMAS